jgi:hypothetical protein
VLLLADEIATGRVKSAAFCARELSRSIFSDIPPKPMGCSIPNWRN